MHRLVVNCFFIHILSGLELGQSYVKLKLVLESS